MLAAIEILFNYTNKLGFQRFIVVLISRDDFKESQQAMNQQQFMRSLSTEQRRALTQKSDGAGFRYLAVHGGLIVLLGCLIVLRVPLWPVLLVPQGILIVFLFTLLHETLHRTPFATPVLNDRVGLVCGFLLGLAPEWFRCFHFAHHRHTQDPEKDPERASKKPATVWQYLVHVSGFPVWFSHLNSLLNNARGKCEDEYVPGAKRQRVRSEARCMLGIYLMVFLISVIFQWNYLLYVWLIPALLGQPFLRLYLLAEHGRCAFVSDVYDNARTTISNRFVRRLAWNMPFHAEHHAFPSVPFFRLNELHELMKDDLKEVERGYGSFNRSYVGSLAKTCSGRNPCR